MATIRSFENQLMSAVPAPVIAQVPIEIRVGYDSDRNFIGDSWTRTLLTMGHNAESHDFFRQKLADILAHLERSSVLVAHHAEDPNKIVSYLCSLYRGSIFVVHFAYTKELGRRQGHVRKLLEVANPMRWPTVFTQPAKNENVMRHFLSKYIYDPTIWSET
jgi:hypothetical protein